MIRREKSDLTGLVTGAIFSDCLKYRYRLWRRWDAALPKVNFLMLNPSTADDVRNDPTVERCERRTRAMGGGELIVTNIFGLRATDPRELLGVADPAGPENAWEVMDAARCADMVVCAWGAGFGADDGNVMAVFLRHNGVPLYCLGKTKAGHPRHPLYVPYAQPLEPF